jgi:MFS family permease
LISLLIVTVALVLLGPSVILKGIPLDNWYLPLISMFMIGITNSLAFVPLLTEIIDAVEDKEKVRDKEEISDKCSAVYNCTWAFGNVVAPIGGGLMVDSINWQNTCDVLALVAVIYTGIYLAANIIPQCLAKKTTDSEEQLTVEFVEDPHAVYAGSHIGHIPHHPGSVVRPNASIKTSITKSQLKVSHI